MKLASFSILTLLSLSFAFLTYTESSMYQNWQQALDQQKEIQVRAAYFQDRNAFIYQLLKRMTIDSQNDLALKELLKQNGVKLVITPTHPTRDASALPVLPTMPSQPGSPSAALPVPVTTSIPHSAPVPPKPTSAP